MYIQRKCHFYYSLLIPHFCNFVKLLFIVKLKKQNRLHYPNSLYYICTDQPHSVSYTVENMLHKNNSLILASWTSQVSEPNASIFLFMGIEEKRLKRVSIRRLFLEGHTCFNIKWGTRNSTVYFIVSSVLHTHLHQSWLLRRQMENFIEQVL